MEMGLTLVEMECMFQRPHLIWDIICKLAHAHHLQTVLPKAHYFRRNAGRMFYVFFSLSSIALSVRYFSLLVIVGLSLASPGFSVCFPFVKALAKLLPLRSRTFH